MLAITSTSWRPWPARTVRGRGSGTTSTGCGRHVAPLRNSSGFARPHPRIALPPGGRAAPAARRGGDEPPRVTLRRHVCGAAAGARTEHEFFDQLASAGVLIRKRYSTQHPGQVTGYAVGLPHHRGRDGGVIWYGGGKLGARLTLPKLRGRWEPRSRGAARPVG